MNFYLMDAGGAGLVFFVMIIFMIAAVVVEGLGMIIMKYNSPGKSFLDALIINLVSLGIGYLLSSVYTIELTYNDVINLFILYLLTVAVEFAVLYFLNKTKPPKQTLIVTAVINVATYIILALLTFMG
jgi:hypothetical protein